MTTKQFIKSPRIARSNCTIVNNKIMKGKNKAKGDDSDDDDASQASIQVNTDNTAKFIPIAKLGDKPRTKKIIINISDTQYPIVEEIAQQLGWIIQKEEGAGDWDVWWTDRQIEPNTLFRMNLHQKINHFPGIYILARKNLFGLGLMSMQQHYPEEYNFFPETWTIPLQFSQFRHYYQSSGGKNRTYIVKPEALSQGRGIFLTRNIEDILNGNKYVIQKYIKNPLLIDKLKFDLRIYVLLAGTDPLRLYIYHEGLTRFATEQYQEPNAQNMARSYIHLTNYSLNKTNPNYVFNTSDKDMDKGHKRTLTSTYERLAKNGVDVQKMKLSIEDAIIKSVISGLPNIRHQYQYCQPEQYEGGMCFHILGFDVMLTDDLKPIVIEVNHTPSFETGTPLDYLVKKNLIKDTLKLMRITKKNKCKNFQRAKEIAKLRLETGKRDIFKGKEREEIIKKARAERDQLQKDLMGGYKRIYPPADEQIEKKYNKFYETALKISKEQNQTRKKLMNEEKKQEKKGKVQPKEKPTQKPESTEKIKTEPRDADKTDEVKKEEAPLEEEKIQHSQRTSKVEEIKTAQQVRGKAMYEEQAYALGSRGQTENKSKMTHRSLKISNLEQEMLKSEINADNGCQDQREQLERGDEKHKKFNFRTKVNRKGSSNTGSNQQLIKYTESVKKFNELLVRFKVQKQEIRDPQSQDLQHKSFLKLKRKLMVNRQGKTNSQNKNIINADTFNLRETKSIPMNPAVRGGNAKDIKLQVRNGSFLRPKNYLLADDSNLQRKEKKNQQGNSNREVPAREAGTEYLIGGIVIENRSTKGYSKMPKNALGRNPLPFRR